MGRQALKKLGARQSSLIIHITALHIPSKQLPDVPRKAQLDLLGSASNRLEDLEVDVELGARV